MLLTRISDCAGTGLRGVDCRERDDMSSAKESRKEFGIHNKTLANTKKPCTQERGRHSAA